MMLFTGLLLSSLVSATVAAPMPFPPNAWEDTLAGFSANLESRMTETLETMRKGQNGRFLQSLFPDVPPAYSCGEIVSVASKTDVLDLVAIFITSLFPPGSDLGQFAGTATAILQQTVLYGVQARVLCGTCAEIEQMYAGESFLTDSSEHGWLSYCASGKFGAADTQSGLLILPFDDASGLPVEGKLKSVILTHGITSEEQDVLSGYFPSNFSATIEQFKQLNSTELTLEVFNLYLVWASILASASGVATIAPDGLGFGQSYQQTKAFVNPPTLKQASAVLFRKAQKEVPTITGGCVELESSVTVGGYSEGGLAAFVGALALQQMGVQINEAALGAPLLDLNFNSGWGLDKFQRQNATFFLQATLPFLAYGYSSTNPDFANTNVGQDLASNAYLDPNNPTRNARTWMEGSVALEDFATFFPFSDVVSVLNPAWVAESTNYTAAGLAQCSSPTAGVTDKLCEAILANTIIDQARDPPFPVSICHSPTDDVIAFENSPDVSLSDNLRTFALLGNSAVGSHFEASLFCLFAFVSPFNGFSPFPGLDTKSIAPLDGQCVPPMPTSAPINPMPSVSNAPTSAPVVTTDPSGSPSAAPITPAPTPSPTMPTSAARTGTLSALLGAMTIVATATVLVIV